MVLTLASVPDSNFMNLASRAHGAVDNTSKELQRELLHLLTSGSKACMAAEQSSGIRVLDLMTRNLQEMTQMNCPQQRKKWITILQVCPPHCDH